MARYAPVLELHQGHFDLVVLEHRPDQGLHLVQVVLVHRDLKLHNHSMHQFDVPLGSGSWDLLNVLIAYLFQHQAV